MNEFSNSEMADMHYVYGTADGNGRAAARMYLQRIPNRHQPSHVLFGQCTADCVNQELSKYVATSVENVLRGHLS